MFSLSGKVNSQIPCFPCAVATLALHEISLKSVRNSKIKRLSVYYVPNHAWFYCQIHKHCHNLYGCFGNGCSFGTFAHIICVYVFECQLPVGTGYHSLQCFVSYIEYCWKEMHKQSQNDDIHSLTTLNSIHIERLRL